MKERYFLFLARKKWVIVGYWITEKDAAYSEKNVVGFLIQSVCAMTFLHSYFCQFWGFHVGNTINVKYLCIAVLLFTWFF